MKMRLVMIALALGLLGVGSTGCIVRTGPAHRHQGVHHQGAGKHAHRHCHSRGRGRNTVCHNHPHNASHHN